MTHARTPSPYRRHSAWFPILFCLDTCAKDGQARPPASARPDTHGEPHCRSRGPHARETATEHHDPFLWLRSPRHALIVWAEEAPSDVGQTLGDQA
jgi:hypothetical protein